MLVDSHCHLNFPEFEYDLDQVIQNANQQGVTTFLTVNTRLDQTAHLQKIAETYERVFFSVGVHPHDAAEFVSKDLVTSIRELTQHPKAVGIGETGLDYHYNNSPRQEQLDSFHQHLQASTELDLPIIIHTREADEDTLACLDDHPNAKGVFHCFSGSADLARAALDRGFYLSFSGIITFKTAEELRQVVRFAPMDRILVETDSPFLAPIPHRGRRNEPAFTRINAEKIAEVKEISFEDVAIRTTKNFFNLFSKSYSV
ncbi:TatD family hydrolase [Candidatus Finniella inopinata]|uniref:TatD family deoxyribonuclease n=1 Tax=Candidatus Finniella inopinata TaxID=1696036 RepID=A0A4Q7DKL3_9PROT|nr:TatD family hydrolase [Candidatus Finniella inopinata]RZI46745.1 TatD family deoxyribonuclease [Candidatus Finniella inopinata]